MITRKSGFTLLELLITTLILGLTLAATSDMFVGMLRGFKQQSKLSETNIEGIVGLEVLRQDIERAGYGLPWVIPSTVTYQEAAAAPASAYNDCSGAAPCNPPRPILSDKNYTMGFNNGSNYPDLIVIKATNLARDAASQKWTYLTNTVTKSWDIAAENLQVSDYVIALSPGAVDSEMRTLVQASGTWSPQFDTSSISSFVPGAQDPQPVFVYGIGSSIPRMPFNRADYLILDPTDTAVKIPDRCAPNTGVLVKKVLNQSNGLNNTDILPLLDCVADMKVIFRLDRNGDGNITPTDALNDVSGTALTAQQIRTQVKEVRVYILAQVGMKDESYTNNIPIYVGDSSPAMDGLLGHTFNIGANVNYRWKLYTIVVQPKNMRQ